jgi:hypothetical protein
MSAGRSHHLPPERPPDLLPDPHEALPFVLGFDRHVGETLGSVATHDRQYVEWLARQAYQGHVLRAARAVLKHLYGGNAA